MSEYDPKKSLGEEIAGLADVLRVLSNTERDCEERLARAENELNAARKLSGFAKIEIERKRAALVALSVETEK